MLYLRIALHCDTKQHRPVMSFEAEQDFRIQCCIPADTWPALSFLDYRINTLLARCIRAKIHTSLVPQLGLQIQPKLQLNCQYWIPQREQNGAYTRAIELGLSGGSTSITDMWMVKIFLADFFNYFQRLL